MAKKIYISPSNQKGNLYATGDTNEREQCHKIAKACEKFLKRYGFTVMCTYNDDMYERVAESNAFGADIHLAIHTNATAKHNVTGGTQVLLYDLSGKRMKLGQSILNYLAPMSPGNSAEGLVKKPTFYEINSAKGITAYCECEFHDTKPGSDFIIQNTTAIGEAIAKGICDYYGVSFEEKQNASPQGETLYTVQIGAFKSRKNAQDYLEKARKAGFNGFITKKT